ncbi:MAG TPA: six-cysteine ranthipeptide SCIFF [Feifaniaceae bacterium]|nr:six-cysteine ranthipeptide SCIFF [Feifaniaceae bacterium]
MKHISTIQKPCIKTGSHTACGECQASCQSACKTSCTVANQKCANPRVAKESKQDR